MEDTSSGLRGVESLLTSLSSNSDRNAEGWDQSDWDEYRDIGKDSSCTGMSPAVGVLPKTRASLRVFRTRSARSSESRKFVVGDKGAPLAVGMGGSGLGSGLEISGSIDVAYKTGSRVVGSGFEEQGDGLGENDDHESDSRLENRIGDI